MTDLQISGSEQSPQVAVSVTVKLNVNSSPLD